MKASSLFLLVILVACNNSSDVPERAHPVDRTNVEPPKRDTNRLEVPADTAAKGQGAASPQAHASNRFNDGQVKKAAGNRFRGTGKARVFEARFDWAVQHNGQPLATGFESTDAGAPAWRNFAFALPGVKAGAATPRPLVLFESGAKDGGRQHQPVVPFS